jgi:hypothetical protein
MKIQELSVYRSHCWQWLERLGNVGYFVVLSTFPYYIKQCYKSAFKQISTPLYRWSIWLWYIQVFMKYILILDDEHFFKFFSGVTNGALGKPLRSTKGFAEHSLGTAILDYIIPSVIVIYHVTIKIKIMIYPK